jgi:hypothetical protein
MAKKKSKKSLFMSDIKKLSEPHNAVDRGSSGLLVWIVSV